MDIAMLCAVSPFRPFDGHRLAVLSDVRACLDNRLSLGVMAFTYGQEPGRMLTPLCPYEGIPAKEGNFAVRLARGLCTRVPPSTERLYGETAYARIRANLLAWKPQAVILNDASVSGYLPLVRELLPRARVIVRSHNVMHDVRTSQLRLNRSFARPMIALDTRRYIAMERAAVLQCDDHWAISEADALRLQQLYGRPSKVLSVSIDGTPYSGRDRADGEPSTFVHIGTVDFRRRTDFVRFLETKWTIILRALPASRLVVAGKLHGGQISAPNASYLGFVEHDNDAYRIGRFALNFQRTTGGVKIKTLTAFAAGRVLLSTLVGVEGFSLCAGTHYVDLDSLNSVDVIKGSLGNQTFCKDVATAGYEYVTKYHSLGTIAKQFLSNVT